MTPLLTVVVNKNLVINQVVWNLYCHEIIKLDSSVLTIRLIVLCESRYPHTIGLPKSLNRWSIPFILVFSPGVQALIAIAVVVVLVVIPIIYIIVQKKRGRHIVPVCMKPCVNKITKCGRRGSRGKLCHCNKAHYNYKI